MVGSPLFLDGAKLSRVFAEEVVAGYWVEVGCGGVVGQSIWSNGLLMSAGPRSKL